MRVTEKFFLYLTVLVVSAYPAVGGAVVFQERKAGAPELERPTYSSSYGVVP